jgi:adenylate cyclase
MTTLDALLNWVQGREQLLSGLAALVVLIGVIVSPLGHGLRMLVARRRGAQPGHGPQAGAAHPAVVMDRPSIAVLPFDNLSDDRDLAFTADGMSEDIITELSRDRRLFVIARNSSFAYKDKRPNVRDVGRELGVHFVLEGSVRRVGESLRVNAQLIDAQSGAHVWAETLNGNFADAAKALDEIGHSIATALTSHFFREDAAGAAKTESLQAWEFLARSAVKWATSQDGESAVRILGQALEKYPDSAHLWAQMGHGLAFGWLYDPDVNFTEISRHARSCIERALELAPNDPSIVAAQGACLLWTGEPKAAVPVLRRAFAQLPNEVPLHINLAYALLHSGSPMPALAEMDQLERRGLHDVYRSVYDLARADIEIGTGNFVQAEDCARKAIAGGGKNPWAWITLALALAAQDRIDEAQVAMRDVLQYMPLFTPQFYDGCVRILSGGDETLFAGRLRLMTLAWPSNRQP